MVHHPNHDLSLGVILLAFPFRPCRCLRTVLWALNEWASGWVWKALTTTPCSTDGTQCTDSGARPPAPCLAWGKLCHMSVPQFPHLHTGDHKSSAYLLGLLCRLKRKMWGQYLGRCWPCRGRDSINAPFSPVTAGSAPVAGLNVWVEGRSEVGTSWEGSQAPSGSTFREHLPGAPLSRKPPAILAFFLEPRPPFLCLLLAPQKLLALSAAACPLKACRVHPPTPAPPRQLPLQPCLLGCC